MKPAEKSSDKNAPEIEKPRETKNSVDKLSENLSSNMAEEITNSYVPEQAQIDAQNATEIPQEISDKSGAIFDADLHAVDDAGNPKLTKAGNFAKKRGRKAGGTSTVNLPQKPKAGVGTLQAAQAAAGLYVQTGIAVFGEEWQPETIEGMGNEYDHLTGCFHRYFEAKEIDDFPPGVALAVGMVSYAARRFDKPNTKKGFARFKDYVAMKWTQYRYKKGSKNAAHSNPGNDGKRKDDTGDKAGK